MILLPSKFSENFETGDECSGGSAIDSEESKDCSDTTFSSNNESVRLEFVQLFSPTVFETVEVYTLSDHSTNVVSEFIENLVMSSENEATVRSPGLNLDLQTLEPGTYTLDVFEKGDFNFDTVFADRQKFKSDAIEARSVATLENLQSCVKSSNSTKKNISELLVIRNRKNNSSHKTPSPRYSPRATGNARQFLNNFSNDLQKSEEQVADTNLSWLLDFKISSIFDPVETETDNSDEKIKRKSNDSKKKPRYTYTELIEQALKENGELTVSGIYSWISSRYPYYQQHDDRWKNSVRHNLSINPQFRKGKKASQGAGHFWNISESIAQNFEPHVSRTNSSLLRLNVEKSSSERVETNSNIGSIATSLNELMNQIDDEVLAVTKSIQKGEAMSFIDVNLHEAAEQHLRHENLSQISHKNTTRNDIEQLWESTTETISDQRYGSLSPLIRELTDDSGRMYEENFLIEDIHNSVCLGDELFAEELYSPYYSLTTI